MDDIEQVEITSDNVHHFENVLAHRLDGGSVLRGANGQPLQFIAVSRNGQHEYIDNSMLTADFITFQLNSGLSVNFATTDQTIQAAQQNQQQLLAQTTVIDEQFIVQHDQDEQTDEILTEEQQDVETKEVPLHFEAEPLHQVMVSKQPKMPSLTPIPRATSTRSKALNMQPTVNLTSIKSELLDDFVCIQDDDDRKPTNTKKQQISSGRTTTLKRPAAADTSKNTKELPHKKRISNQVPQGKITTTTTTTVKLPTTTTTTTAHSNTDKKQPVQRRSQPETKNVPLVEEVPKVDVNALACEICGLVMATQLEFFRHLKLHYEPVTLMTATPTPSPPKPIKKESPKVVVKVPVVAEPVVERSKRLRKPTVRANESAATVLRSSKKLAITPPPAPTPPNPPKQNKQKPKPKASPSTPQSVQELLEQFPNNDAHDEDIDDEAIHTLDDNDDHDNDSDYVATNNEFSDAEDMLEGIRGTVDKVVDTELGSDLNTKHEWFDSELAEEIIFSNADIEGQQDDDDDDDMDRDEGDVVEADTEANDENDLDPDYIKIESKSDSGDEDVEEAKPSPKKRVKPPSSVASKLDYTEIRDETKGKRGKGKKSFKCNVCEKICKSMNALQYHFLSHTGERPHRCDQCGKGFMASSALKVHMRLHTGQKPHVCEICSRAFRQWGDLKYHMTSLHSEEKNHQCEYCGKDFARRYSLVIHRRIHTGERNYKCEYCNKSFRASTYLMDHRRIHTGEKPHECEYCDKKFRVRGDLKRHWNIHLRSALPMVKGINDFDEVAAAIQIIDDGKGGFTVKSEDDTSPSIAKPQSSRVAVGLHGYRAVDPIELAKKMPVPRKTKQEKYPRVRLPGDE